MTYRRRTKSDSLAKDDATNTCLNAGADCAASRPMQLSSTGTSRSPRKRHPSRSAVSRNRRRQVSASRGSVGRNSWPTAYSPKGGRSNGTVLRKNPSGSCSINPAPSLVLPSAPIAQRCSRLARILTPFSTSECAGCASRLTINPMPQLSRSFCGSYNPKARGSPALFD